MKPINKVLVSVSDKTGLIEFLRPLYQKFKFQIVSTGGTAEYLKKNDFNVTDVSELTNFPEVLDGRVKTLHPHIHMSLLAQTDKSEHMQTLKKFSVTPFDMVVGNLYPFEQTAAKSDVKWDELIEKIDVGGPTFLRAAAKNHKSIVVVTDPNDYEWVLQKCLSDQLNENDHLRLALKVFASTAYYDAVIFKKLSENLDTSDFNKMAWPVKKIGELRYGENSHQKSSFFENPLSQTPLNGYKFLQGKELSYNNWLDLDAALNLVLLFNQPACVAVKHNNPCGVGWADDISTATEKAIEADPKSVFGGILAFNRRVDLPTIKNLSSIFLECLIAPEFTVEALEALQQKKNLRVLTCSSLGKNTVSIKSIAGHFLVQDTDSFPQSDWTIVGNQPTKIMRETIEAGEKICGFLKSNSIAIVHQGQTLGLGMGQVNRVDAVEQALKRLSEFKTRSKVNMDEVVLVSDAFFPFPDSVELIAQAGLKWIVQPGGSTKDNLVLESAKNHNLNMILTGVRHFRH